MVFEGEVSSLSHMYEPNLSSCFSQFFKTAMQNCSYFVKNCMTGTWAVLFVQIRVVLYHKCQVYLLLFCRGLLSSGHEDYLSTTYSHTEIITYVTENLLFLLYTLLLVLLHKPLGHSINFISPFTKKRKTGLPLLWSWKTVSHKTAQRGKAFTLH